MKIIITVKRTPGTREKDREITVDTIADVSLQDARILWEFEQFMNSSVEISNSCPASRGVKG